MSHFGIRERDAKDLTRMTKGFDERMDESHKSLGLEEKCCWMFFNLIFGWLFNFQRGFEGVLNDNTVA